ncbi:hypothetical protein Bbelb_386620 [Branchiostoma belcheri]|nr:hypothetical protein Bbelb_386620 [Branchiostoma belcheri]
MALTCRTTTSKKATCAERLTLLRKQRNARALHVQLRYRHVLTSRGKLTPTAEINLYRDGIDISQVPDIMCQTQTDSFRLHITGQGAASADLPPETLAMRNTVPLPRCPKELAQQF